MLPMTDLNLAVIGNSILAALVDRSARIVWCCFPSLDGDPVFCNLLGGEHGDAGLFAIDVEGQTDCRQHYRRNTAVLVTEITDGSGAAIRVTDFVPRLRRHERIFRPSMLVRRIEPVAGTCHIRIRVRPRFAYGAVAPTIVRGSNHIRYAGPDFTLRLTTDAPLAYLLQERLFILESAITLVLGPDESLTTSLSATARDFLELTEEYWLDWTRYLNVPFEWQQVVIRAAITLKLCSFEETGAIVAALTTSIPEAANSGRNWDYRYCWLRDAFFVVQALNRLGATRTMEDFLRYIANVASLDPAGYLRPVYSVVPGAAILEEVAEALPGYRGMGPVRIGNLAETQIQNDSYGSVILASAQMFYDQRLPRCGDVSLFARLERLGEQAVAIAFTPDSGLWEFRNSRRVHTHSAAMCWAACDRLAKIAATLALAEREQIWRQHAERLHGEIMARCWNASLNTFVVCVDGTGVDASLLLLHEIGLVSPTDPKFIGTVDAITRALYRDGHLLRYATEDDFGTPQSAFNVCTLWYIDALAAMGRRTEARELFERLLACCNHVGLLSEDVDSRTGELWGNFPQTYSMVGLIICAMRLSRTWEEAFWRGS
jgi:GH15 family glucan-1,4-alpha-glucosidase